MAVQSAATKMLRLQIPGQEACFWRCQAFPLHSSMHDGLAGCCRRPSPCARSAAMQPSCATPATPLPTRPPRAGCAVAQQLACRATLAAQLQQPALQARTTLAGRATSRQPQAAPPAQDWRGGSQAATSVTSSAAGGPSAQLAVTPVSLLERFGSADDLDKAGLPAGSVVLAGRTHSQAAAVGAKTEPAPAAGKPQRTGLPQAAAAGGKAGSASPGSSTGSGPGRPDLHVEDSSQQVWHDADSSGSPGQSEGASTPRELRGAGAGPGSLPPAADGTLQAAGFNAAAAALEQAAGTAAPPGLGAEISAEGSVEAPKEGQLMKVGSGGLPSTRLPQHLLNTALGSGPAGMRLAAASEQASR